MGKISKSYLKELAEKKKYKSGGFSTEGYKRNSPDVNNPYNVIPSNQITMKGVDFPVMGTDNMGYQQMMYPGQDYTFPGEYVTEFPLKNMGNKRYGQVGFYKPEFRSKSQIANTQGGQREYTNVPVKRTPTEAKAIREKELAELKRKTVGTIRETTDADREAQNRQALTFAGNAEKRGVSSPLNDILDVVNPFSYYYAGKDAVRGLEQAAEGVTSLNLEQIGSGLAGATLGALGAIPSTSEFKPLFGVAGKTFAKPALKAASTLGKPGISTNLADLQAAKKFAKQYGYDLPKDLERVAKSDVLTDRTIRGLMNRHNTFVRGVSTNWDVIEDKVGPKVWGDIVENFEKQGIDYINNPKAAAEYMATHIPIETGYGRFGLKPGENALYLSNSMPTAEGYSYGQGYMVKGKRPTDFSSLNRQDWIKANEYPVSYGFKGSPFNTGIVKNDYYKRVPTSLRDIAYAAGDPSIIQNAMKKSDEAYKLATERDLKLREEYVNRIRDMRVRSVQKNNPEYTGSHWDYKMPNLVDRAKETYYNTLMGFSHLSAEASVIPPVVGGFLDKRNMAALGRNLVSPVFGKIDPFSHYAIKGVPGEKVLEPIRSLEVTPQMWSNKSRAHVGKYSKGFTRREFGGVIPGHKATYQSGGTNDSEYMNFVRTLPPNLAQPNDPSYNLKGYWEASGSPKSFDYNQPTDPQGYYHAFSRNPRTGQILKAPFHPSFKEGVSDKGAYRLVSPRGDVYTQGFKYPAYEGYYGLPKNAIIDNNYDFLDKPNYEGYFQGGGKNTSQARSFMSIIPNFIPVVNDALDFYDVLQGAYTGNKVQMNQGIIGLTAPGIAGKGVGEIIDYATEKTLGKQVADQNQAKREGIVNMSTSDLQKLYLKYGPGGYDKWKAAGFPKLQMGGTIGIPGVNGQVVSSGPQPLTSVKKTRGPITKNKKGDIKTMSNQQVKQVLKYSKQKPNKI